MSTATDTIGEVIFQDKIVGYFRFVDGKAEPQTWGSREDAVKGKPDMIMDGDNAAVAVVQEQGEEATIEVLLYAERMHWPATWCPSLNQIISSFDPNFDDSGEYGGDRTYRNLWPRPGHPHTGEERVENLTIARVKTECPFCSQLVTDDHSGRCIPEMNNRLMIMQHGLQLAYAALKKSDIKREKCPELFREMESAMSGMGAAPAAFFQGYFMLCESICKAVASGEDHAALLKKWTDLQAKNKDGTLKEGKSVVNWKPGRQRQSREQVLAEALERPDVIEMLRKAGVKI